ncbi:glycosyltransferase family 2 protein [Streptococcus pluranimalium]|uniref:glycosyltransferase family 2 protein n=1 Tax=Streptococcus pluranimalium TaxID=82348 RepID=UPI002415103A|nr:glycosyltransferase family 2 protein [Streptococcus pluranimalium]WFM80493.1 glycosyltransferase family 2 protein [Streptococcus pluranimalium]
MKNEINLKRIYSFINDKYIADKIVEFLEKGIDIEKIKKVNINISLMVKNQEGLIEGAIKSIESVCDNIWIFDTGSTDETLSIIKSLKNSLVKLNQIQWIDNFAAMRNRTIEEIPKNEWIFIIDSDEIFLSEIKKDELKCILYAIEKIFPNSDPILTIQQESSGNYIVNRPQRIFKNNKELIFYGYVHEELRSQKSILINMNLRVYNEGTSINETKKFDKYLKYNKLLLKNIELEPDFLKWLALLDITYGLDNYPNYKEKVELFCSKIIEETGDIIIDDLFKMKIFCNYFVLLINEKNIDKAKYINKFCIEHFNDNSIFIIYNYLIKLQEINLGIENEFYNFRKDIRSLAQKDKNNLVFQFNHQIITEITIKFLFKIEEYLNATSLLYNFSKKDVFVIKQELNFIENLLNEANFPQ